VRIAILDTGIDIGHPSIIGAMRSKPPRIHKSMQSFVEDDGSIKDECGHGTHIAALLSRVAPQAEIYIAKVAQNQEIPPNHKIAKVSTSPASYPIDRNIND
jgi:subtilisin family serine protease